MGPQTCPLCRIVLKSLGSNKALNLTTVTNCVVVVLDRIGPQTCPLCRIVWKSLESNKALNFTTVKNCVELC
jgi:hypothetical protein